VSSRCTDRLDSLGKCGDRRIVARFAAWLTTEASRQLALATQDPGRKEELMNEPDGKRFRCLYYDVPWPKQGGEAHYETLSLADIRSFVIQTAHLAEDDAHCYFWTTNRYLRDSYDILSSAGWTVRSPWTWVKFRLGLGGPFQLRNSTEHILFATRGRLPVMNRSIPTWLTAPVTAHSEKPGAFFESIELLSPGPRVEFFARRQRPGWECWGNEVQPTIAPIDEFPTPGDFTFEEINR
jgi:N6-adenosine-specific RNA methylase IME4